jgi:ankyrin repeat protein
MNKLTKQMIKALAPDDPSKASLEEIKKVVAAGYDINENIDTEEFNEIPPLNMAAMHQQVDIMKWLIEEGADVNAVSGNGFTTLHEACGFVDDPEAAELLIKNGANIEALNYDGETALQEAVVNGNVRIVKLLLEKGARVNEDCLTICKEQLKREDLVEQRDKYQEILELLEKIR